MQFCRPNCLRQGTIKAAATHDRTHHWVVRKTIRIVQILIARRPEHGLPQRVNQSVPAVPARPPFASAEPVEAVKPSASSSSRYASSPASQVIAAKAEHQAAVKVEPQRPTSRFT